jgi:hypothetical protein
MTKSAADGGEVMLAEMAGPVTALVTRGMLRGIRRRAAYEHTCISRPATSQDPAR